MEKLLKIWVISTIILTISGVVFADAPTGSISGTVTDDLGDPIAELEVEAEGYETEEEAGSATTDANGFYTITDLPSGEYLVEACAGCTGLYYVNELYNNKTSFDEADAVTVEAPNTTSGIDFELVQSGAITGTVTDSLGNPIANLMVEAENYDDEDSMDMDSETDANGVYIITALPPGDYRVSTESSETGLNYGDKYYDNTTSWELASRVTITGTQTTEGINFVLSQGGSISGTVTDSQENPIEDLVVHANPYNGQGWEGGSSANTDANGYYILTGLSSGSYRVETCSGCTDLPYANKFYNNTTDWDSATAVTVTAPNTTAGIDFSLGLGTYITGYVYGWDSNSDGYVALEGAHLSAEYFSGGGGWAGDDSDANGFYKISGLSAGEYRVRVDKYPYIEQYYPSAIDWAEAEPLEVDTNTPATDINFNLDLGGTITGTILDETTQEPITDAWVNASPTNGEPWGRGAHEIDSNGVYIISGLPAGTYKVSASSDGYDEEFYEEQTDWMMAEHVEVTVGETTVGVNFTLKQEAGGAIVGQVVLPDDTPVEDAHVNADSMEHMKWKNGQTDANGNFQITGITPGTWRVQAHAPWGEDYRGVSNSAEMFIDVDEGTTLTNIGKITLPTVNLIGLVLMPDDSPAQWAPVNIETLDWSYFAHVNTDSDGYFRAGGLSAGTYKIRVELPWGTDGIVPPEPNIIEITDPNTILDMGTIKYTTAAKHIQGRVQRSNEEGVANVEVNGWRRGMEGWAHTRTDPNGDFSLDVAAGTWELMIHPPPQATDIDWIYLSHPKVVTFADDTSEETKSVTFTVESAASKVTGRVLGPNGGTLRQGCVWIDIRDDQGRGNGVPVESGGTFSVSVREGTYNIWIGVDQRTYPHWSSPEIAPFRVAENQTVVLPDIKLLENNSGIEGTVTRSSDGEPVAGVFVHAWQHEGGWKDTTTDENGNYRLSVRAGNWEVAAEPPYTSSYVSGQPPQRVVVQEGQTVSDIDFVLVKADGTIEGSLYDSNDNLLTDMGGGWAYARRDLHSHEPVAGAPVENGQFSLKVPNGTYYVGVHLPPNSGYTMSGEEEVTVDSDSEAEVALTMLGNDATIIGTFYTDANKTTPATNLEGEVFAMQGMGGVWQNTRINSDGTYSLRVSAGKWNLGYWIMSAGYINNPPPDNHVTAVSGQSTTFDFTLVSADATIQGVILDPNGNALTHAWAWAHSEGNDTNKRIDCGGESREPGGSFSISVPSGRHYEVGAHAPESWGYIQPEMQTVTPGSGQTVEVVLQFKNSDATITGSVYYTENGGNINCPHAWVNAWSDDSQHTGSPADFDGNYRLNVSKGTTWHIDAVYHSHGDANFYETASPTDVEMTSAEATANLEVALSDERIPAAASATFDPNVGWTHTMENGTRIEIPGGAIPATDTVCISMTPMVDNLRKTSTDRPLGCGYAISISEDSTGNPIVDNFNTNVLITFSYTDEFLEEKGLTEDDISPAYYSTTTDSWTKVESFTIDKNANTVTVQINHFSVWALTGGQGAEAEGGEGTEEVALTIQKCTVKAGRTQAKDDINLSGQFASSLDDIESASRIVVNISSVTDDYLVYNESINFDPSSIKRGRYSYRARVSRGDPGAITSLRLDLNKKTISIKAKNINLTGLSCPLLVEVTIGSYALSGQANESIVNGTRKTVPMRLMRTYSDQLSVSRAKARAGRKASTDSLSIKGDIAVELAGSTDLAEQDVVITWASQTFTIPAGSFSARRGQQYRCRNVSPAEAGIVSGSIYLDKCTFNISIKKATIDEKSGTVSFGISFASFDETSEVNL